MDPTELEYEKNKLKEIVAKIAAAKAYLEDSLNTVGSENLAKLKDLKENPETNLSDFNLFLEQIHQKNVAFNIKDKYIRLDELTNLKEQPYFARIDLAADQEVNKVYIGKFGYTENQPVVTDWRAKVASVYYRYRFPQKNVSYDTPDGREVRDLKLKRTFELDAGKLLKYFNNDIQLDESEIISEKIAKRTGGVLEDIVETIQESQLDIIESDPRQLCIVQGCVGSGKSTVAIHKLSHIFFNYPNIIRPERSIVIAKNQILVGYLSTLFPKLGIFDLAYKTLKDIIVQIIYAEELKVTTDLEDESDFMIFTASELAELRQEITVIHTKYEQELTTLFTHEDFEGFSGFVYSINSSPYENISEAIEDLEEELELQTEAYKESPKSLKAMLHRENIKTLKKLITKLKRLRLSILSENFPKLTAKYGIHSDEKLTYFKALIYITLYLELIGIRKHRLYEYCVVDEGQDFNLLEYYMLSKIVLNGRFSILGDLNQSVDEKGISEWDEIIEAMQSAKNAQKFTLETNYRSTKPIIDLANTILTPYTSAYLPNSINRKGPDPVIIDFDSFSHLEKALAESLTSELTELKKSIGIICFSANSYNLADQIVSRFNLQQGKYIKLDPTSKITYIPKGVYLTHFENCKGLEFSKVYVLDLNLSDINTFIGARKAFVAVTRAMNEVEIYSVKNK